MSFAPVDLLTSVFAALLCLVGLAGWNALDEKSALVRLLVVALVPVAVARVRKLRPNPGPVQSIVQDFYIAAAVVVIFDSLGPLIRAVNPRDKDAWLIAFDRALFGFDPTVALARFATPLLSDVLTFCYALYYFHPIILGGLLYADDRRAGRTGQDRTFRRFAFVIVAVFYVSYVGYFLMPAIGPRFTIPHAAPLPRGMVAESIDRTLNFLERNKRDCFPSGHTMVVTAVLLEGARRSRKTFLGFLPFAIGLVAATVYGRYHYVADVLAGALLAVVTVPAASWLLAKLDRRTAPGAGSAATA
ncbi:MAG: phosphatase PAP2 family protein [Thermoanaerobaculia bacterium]